MKRFFFLAVLSLLSLQLFAEWLNMKDLKVAVLTVKYLVIVKGIHTMTTDLKMAVRKRPRGKILHIVREVRAAYFLRALAGFTLARLCSTPARTSAFRALWLSLSPS